MDHTATYPFLALLALLPACEDPGQDWRSEYNFAWHGQHVSVYGYGLEQDHAFGGSLAFIDEYTGMLTAHLGYSPGAQIDYQWMSPEFFQGKCPADAGACTLGGEVRSPLMPHMHELAHAVVYSNAGPCPVLLSEGLAEYFSRPRFEFLPGDELAALDGEIDQMFSNAPLRFSEYERAGHFVAYLTETYGLGAVLDLCKAVPRYDPAGHWEHAFEAVLDTNISALLADYADYPLCSTQQYRARLMECSGEIDISIGLHGDTDFSVIMAPERDDIIGPIDGKMVAIRRVWVEQSNYAYVWISNQKGATPRYAIATQECAPCSAKPRLNGNVDPNLYFALREGRHAFLFYLPADRSDTFDVRVRPLIPDP